MTNSEKTILIVDDTTSNIDIVLSILEDYDLIPATSGKDALNIVKTETIDLILLDIVMPEMDGFEVCKTLKENPATSNIPVIFLTAQADEESIEKAYAVGGVDYVTKPFKPVELKARVKVHLEIQSLIKKLDFYATRDSLTGILNRRMFFEKAQLIFDSNDNTYAAMLDLDHFKKVNDEYGHDVGDIVLIETTKLISNLLPENAIFGRIGGEEFALICTHENNDKMTKTINNIVKTFAQTPINITNNRQINCTLSCGLSKKSSSTKNIDELLKLADIGLYEAKQSGRNRSIFRKERR